MHAKEAAMFCTKINERTYTTAGELHVVAELMCDTTPGTMPTTGENIDKLEDNAVLDPGTQLYVIDSGDLYLMNSEGTFVQQ
jgi:hypothetical protein